MKTIRNLIRRLNSGMDLSGSEAAEAARYLAGERGDEKEKGEFLVALAEKGEKPAEVAAFASVFRELALDPGLDAYACKGIDVVGTGGDHSGSFNISTTVAFILAAAGLPVLKHGNRSITSKSGSADLLEALGISLQVEFDQLAESMEKLNFCFLFAPAFHPAFKTIMPIRRKLAEEGRRTIFNILGPLINPARPAFQMVGVFSMAWVAPMAETLHALGLKGGIVVHSSLPRGGGMDELSCAGRNRVVGFGNLASLDAYWTLREFGLSPCAEEDLAGGSAAENVALLNAVLEGKGPSGLVDSILLNAGAALWVGRLSKSVSEGVGRARNLLQTGGVRKWLAKAAHFYGG